MEPRKRGTGWPIARAALALLTLAFGGRGAAVESDGWRAYQTYEPEIERHDVIDARLHPNKYNHCSTIAWFAGRWYCFWGSNTHPDEHAPGQRLVFSTSADARSWTAPGPVFSSAEHCQNPVLYPEGKGHQWQPNAGIVNGELWVVWNQGGSASDARAGGRAAEDLRGLYLSRLKPGGKWVNRRLLWQGQASPVIDGREYRIASTQNLCRLRSGRVLAPVTLYSRDRSAHAPAEVQDWWASAKRDSVIYSDDLGETWQLSPGCALPGFDWVQWEPTVWEQPDGAVVMFARNNRNPSLGHGKIPSSEYLLWSISRDQGATWSAHQPVPIESVCSRMHVAPVDGRGAWVEPGRGDDFSGRPYVMVHNDSPGALHSWAAARRNLALFFKRGGGIDFVAGNNISGFDPEVAYPQMWAHDGTLAISYTVGNSSPRSIRVARINPMPDPQKHYLFPRSNTDPPPARPRVSGAVWSFDAGQRIASRARVDSGESGFSLAAWIQVRAGGALFDTRSAGAPRGGFSLALGPNPGSARQSSRLVYPVACLLTEPHVFGPDLPIERFGGWHYVGLTVNRASGEAVFYVDDKSETVHFAPYPASASKGDTAHIGDKRPRTSQIPGFNGDLRFLALYPSAFLGAEEHAWLHDRLAERLGRKRFERGREPEASPSLWLDGGEGAPGFERGFVLPDLAAGRGVEKLAVDGRPALLFRGEGSAGVDLGENHRERGDRVELRARFRVARGDGHTLCTVGDFNQPARIRARTGRVLLCAGAVELPCGEISPGTWTPIEVESRGATIRARVGEGTWSEAAHRPSGTWCYIGEGYPSYGARDEREFMLDVGSLRTRVFDGK